MYYYCLVSCLCCCVIYLLEKQTFLITANAIRLVASLSNIILLLFSHDNHLGGWNTSRGRKDKMYWKWAIQGSKVWKSQK